MDKLLQVLEANARLTLEEIAAMVNESAEAVAKRIDDYKREGVLRGTRTLVDWDKVGGNGVQALIDVRVSPKKGHGFDEIAEAIALLDEVDGVQLMSGGYDLSVAISGASFQEVAWFVARRLSPMDDVLSTATHFVLRTYKKDGALFGTEHRDERQGVL
ncbi:MAG: Lrp/AsnC family transcriptional regulator [Ruminococcaceae bacterium]|nr:Lrp/AsnC family transcriptional regulator [Oscillospiraceae bacterium]